MRGLLFTMDASLYALRLAALDEVLPMALLRPVPGGHSALLGLLNLRGNQVPVVDLALSCMGRAEPEGLRTRIAVLSATPDSPKPLGVALASTGEIVDVDAHDEKHWAACPVRSTGLPFLGSVGTHEGRTLQWIDAVKLRSAISALIGLEEGCARV